MVMKCVRKLMLVITKLHILILFSVQANNLAPTTFTLSSPPILPPYSSELDAGELHLCLTLAVGQCAGFKSTWPFPDKAYELCIINAFGACVIETRSLEKRAAFHILMYCLVDNCEPKLQSKAKHRQNTLLVRCLLECYYHHVTNPNDVIYMQNR
jgi:hypothetical protein